LGLVFGVFCAERVQLKKNQKGKRSQGDQRTPARKKIRTGFERHGKKKKTRSPLLAAGKKWEGQGKREYFGTQGRHGKTHNFGKMEGGQPQNQKLKSTR